MTSAENSSAIVHRHQGEYKTVYDDATAVKGADAQHKSDAATKFASDLAAIEKADPAYYRTILSQLNGKFKSEDFGLPAGEKLLGGVKIGNGADLVSRSADGKKLNYYGETPAGDSKTGKIYGQVGQADIAPNGDPRPNEGAGVAPAAKPPDKLKDGSGTYTEGKDDHNMWDVARHILGIDKFDTLAKKNEAANLIKLLEKDPTNAKKIKDGTVIHLPPLTLGGLPGAPEAPKAADAPAAAPAPAPKPIEHPHTPTPAPKPAEAPAEGPPPTKVQTADPAGDQTIEDLTKQKNTPGEKPVATAAETLAAAVRKDNGDMKTSSDEVFNQKAADILGLGDASQIRFGSPNDVEDAIWAAQKYGKANPGDIDAQNLIKGLQYMKDNWSKYEVSGMAHSPYLDSASFQKLMEKRTANLAQLDKLAGH